jgi:hypothetical protein
MTFIHQPSSSVALGSGSTPLSALPEGPACPIKIPNPIHRRTGRSGMRRIFVLVLAASAAAACAGGGGQDSESAARTRMTPTTTGGSTTAAQVSVAADRVKAQILLLKSADFPAGWKATAVQNGGLGSTKLAPSTDHTVTADIGSPAFSMGDAQASSSAKIVKPGEDFKMDSVLLRSAEFAAILKKQLTKLVLENNPGASLQSLTVQPLRVKKYGDFSIGYRAAMTMTFKVQGFAVTAYSDTVSLAKGRIMLEANFVNVDRPFDATLRQALLTKLGARLEAA